MGRLILLFLLIVAHSIIFANETYNNDSLLSNKEQSKVIDSLNSITLLLEAKSLAEETKNYPALANSYIDLGDHYKKYNNSFYAISSYNQAASILLELNEKCSASEVLFNIGEIQKSLGMLNEALDNFFESKKLCLAEENLQNYISSNINIGNIYFEFRLFDKAKEYYEIALDYSKQNQLPSYEARALRAIGKLYGEQNKLDTSLYYFHKALNLEKKIESVFGVAIAQANIAVIYDYKGDYESAVKHTLEAFHLFKKQNRPEIVLQLSINLGEFYSKNKDFINADKFINNAIKLQDSLKITTYDKSLVQSLSIIESERGNFKKAFEYHKKYKAISDSLFNERSLDRVADIEKQFKENQRELENSVLKKDNQLKNTQLLFGIIFITIIIIGGVIIGFIFHMRYKTNQDEKIGVQEKNEIITQQNKELNKLNSTKDKFFSIIAHDLKNPFVALLGYSEMLKKEFDHLEDDEKKEFIEGIYSASKNTYSLLENLLNWSRAQRGTIEIRKELIQLRHIVESSVDLYSNTATQKNITIINNVKKTSIVNSDQMMLQTVISNLTGNAMKFTKYGGTITFNTRIDNNDYCLSVSDTGVGMSEETVKNIFSDDFATSTEGTNKEGGTGLGLIVCKEFIEMLGGKITVESDLNKGSKFEISIPLDDGLHVMA